MTLSLEQQRLSPKQLRSLGAALGRVNLWTGSIRSGKTYVSLLAWIAFIATLLDTPPGGELVMVGRTRDSLFRNVFAPIASEPSLAWLAAIVKYRNGAPTATILGRVVHVLGANDAQAEAKIRGMTVAGCYVDEVTVLPAAFFKQLLGRMSVAGARMFATTNPDSPAHWLKVDYLNPYAAGQLAEWRVFHFVLEDNHALDPGYIASIKAEHSGLWYDRYILGRWVAASGAVFGMWDPTRHVIPWATVPPIRTLLAVGMDWGAVNASAALLLGLTREWIDGVLRHRLILVDEFRHDSRKQQRQLTDGELSAQFRAWLNGPHFPEGHHANGMRPRFVVLDPAAAGFREQLVRDGVNVWKADNGVQRGLSLMGSLLAHERLIVTDRCPGFIQEAPGYAWDEKKVERGREEPVKVADHSLDAGRYAVLTTEQFWRPQLDWPESLITKEAA